MTVETEISRSGPYAGAGTIGPFLVDFRILDATHLRVVKLAGGIEVTLAYPADYLVIGVGGPTCTLQTTVAVAVGETLTIIRDVPKTQEADYVQNDDFPAETHENALDKLTMIVQQLAEEQDRALTLPVSASTGVSTELPVPQSNALIGWNSDADALQNVDPATLATIVAFGTTKADLLSGTGAQTVFTLTANPGAQANLDVAVGGVTQRPGIDYTWSAGTTITFSTAPPLGTNNVLVRYQQGLPQGMTDSGGSTFSHASSYGQGTVGLALQGVINVKNAPFNATGDGVTDDTAAILAAMAVATVGGGGRAIYFPHGIYLTSATINVPYGVRIYGESEYGTVIRYTGAGDAIYVGGPGASTIISYGVVEDLTVICMSRAPTVNGVNCDNAVYFSLRRLSIFGSGSPNSPTPADRVLYGNGLSMSNNTIIGEVNKVTTRLWFRGYYLYTRATSASAWTAAISVIGQGEIGNNMYGIQLGDPAVAFDGATGVSFRDVCIQGNYTEGVRIYTGRSTLFDNVYFEGNANYDVVVGGGAALPVLVRINNSPMNTESIGTTPYGTFPYIAKVRVIKGLLTTLKSNDMAITAAIPLIINDAAGDTTIVDGNNLLSAIASTARIQINGGTVKSQNNNPERATMATGRFPWNSGLASGSQVVTGVGFLPTRIDLRATVIGFGPPAPMSIGSVGLGNGIVGSCIYEVTGGARSTSNTHGLEIQLSAGNGQRAALSAAGNDTFTLAFTKFGAPAGPDIEVQWTAYRD